MSSEPQRLVATLVLRADEFAAETVTLEGDRYRHLFRSKRLASGSWIRVVDGLGLSRRALIGRVTRSEASLELGGHLESLDPKEEVTLVTALPKPDRASWLIEKASELGVYAVRWVKSARSPRDLSQSALERHVRVATAALEQCGGARLPKISGSHEWAEVPSLLEEQNGGAIRMLTPDGLSQSSAADGLGPVADSVTLLVGPEGGWSESETAELTDWGAKPASLVVRVLRVETAAILAAGICLSGSQAALDSQ